VLYGVLTKHRLNCDQVGNSAAPLWHINGDKWGRVVGEGGRGGKRCDMMCAEVTLGMAKAKANSGWGRLGLGSQVVSHNA
jgi:hypothetical protein